MSDLHCRGCPCELCLPEHCLGTVKVCRKCHMVRPVGSYLRGPDYRSGIGSVCRHCRNATRLAWRKANPERHRESRRAQELRAYRKPNSHKRARVELGVAKRRGKVVAQPCEVCGATPTHGHHYDYSKPLDVRWLCELHHRLVHGVGT